MQEIIDVSTGQVEVRKGVIVLRAIAIGSCIAVAAYDAKSKNAGLAHIMLPGRAPQGSCEKTKYAYNSIELLLNQMIKLGSFVSDIEVCLVGAGNVLRKQDDTICQSNIQSVTDILKKNNIVVHKSILGGFERKSVFLDVQNGFISCSQGDGAVKLLWKPIEN